MQTLKKKKTLQVVSQEEKPAGQWGGETGKGRQPGKSALQRNYPLWTPGAQTLWPPPEESGEHALSH